MNGRAEASRLTERLAVMSAIADERTNAIRTLEAKLELALKETRDTGFEVARLRERESALWQKLEEQSRQSAARDQLLTSEFENIANRILKTSAAELSDSSQKAVAALLDPLRERIQEFHAKWKAVMTQKAATCCR